VSAIHPDYTSHAVKRLYLLISQRIDDVLKPHGLGRTQWQVLFRVHRVGTLGQKDLQQAMRVEPATLTCVIDALCTKGLLERSDSETDRRCKFLRLTPAGKALIGHIPDAYGIVEARMAAGIGEQERELVQATLERMIANLEDRS